MDEARWAWASAARYPSRTGSNPARPGTVADHAVGAAIRSRARAARPRRDGPPRAAEGYAYFTRTLLTAVCALPPRDRTIVMS